MRELQIHRNNMHTAGTGAKSATVFLLMFGLTGGLGNGILQVISTHAGFSTGQTGQHQQVNTEYEQYYFHEAKITDLISHLLYRM